MVGRGPGFRRLPRHPAEPLADTGHDQVDRLARLGPAPGRTRTSPARHRACRPRFLAARSSGAWSRRARSPGLAQRGEDRVQPAVERPGQL